MAIVPTRNHRAAAGRGLPARAGPTTACPRACRAGLRPPARPYGVAASVMPGPSHAPGRRCAGDALGPQQQHQDEDGEHRDRGEDAADQEVRSLLEQAERQARRSPRRGWSPCRPAPPARSLEVQDRLVAEVGEQHLRAGEARQRADHAGQREARDPQPRLGQAERARRVAVLGDGEEGAADQGLAVEEFQPADGDGAGQQRQPELLVEPTFGAGTASGRAAPRCPIRWP